MKIRTKKKLRKSRMRKFKSVMAEKWALRKLARDEALVPPFRAPRYDDVYFEGLAWLNTL